MHQLLMAARASGWVLHQIVVLHGMATATMHCLVRWQRLLCKGFSVFHVYFPVLYQPVLQGGVAGQEGWGAPAVHDLIARAAQQWSCTLAGSQGLGFAGCRGAGCLLM